MAKRKVKKVTPEEREERRREFERDWKRAHEDADDRERSKLVYKWQADALHFGNQCDWTLLECERFVAYVWHSYFGTRATPPTINPGRGAISASANRSEMTLPVWARNRNIVLHELAHAMLDAVTHPDARVMRGDTVIGIEKLGHGPLFMRMEIELLIAFSTYDRTVITKSAREWGIPVARRNRVPRRRSCEKTIAECRKKHYHSMGEDLADWMKKGTPRLVHVRGSTYREHR